MKIQFLGAAGTVTGSRHLLESGRKRLLVDCGLFQGLKTLRLKNWQPFPVSPARLHAVLLTHAHLDHSGYLPKLVKEGFCGPIFGTRPTLELLKILLPDAAKLMSEDAKLAQGAGASRHRRPRGLFNEADVKRVYKHFSPADYAESVRPLRGWEAVWAPAGHILGAAHLRVETEGVSVCFSGDLGRMGDPLLPDPAPPPEADYFVLESTYGNRLHTDADPKEALAKILDRVLGRGGTLVVPCFAVGRTQWMLKRLMELREEKRLSARIPIFVDSPMASRVSGLYRRFARFQNLNESEREALFSLPVYVDKHADSLALSRRRDPKIILSSSGMATGGRVLNHLETFGTRAESAILFAGFQAAGTRGAHLLEGRREIKIRGRYLPVQAEIVSLENASAHADADGLIRWLQAAPRPPKKVFIVHGEPTASDALRLEIEEKLGWAVEVPQMGESFELS